LAFFEGWWVAFGKHFGWNGTIPSNHHWSGKTTDIPVSYGVEILTDDYFVLPRYMHLTDRQTDRQNCDSNTMHCITCNHTVRTTCICCNNLNYCVICLDPLYVFCIFVCCAVNSIRYILSKRVLLTKHYSCYSVDVLSFSMLSVTTPRVYTMAS